MSSEDIIQSQISEQSKNNIIKAILNEFEKVLKKNNYYLIKEKELKDKLIEIFRQLQTLKYENKLIVINEVPPIINHYQSNSAILIQKEKNNVNQENSKTINEYEEDKNSILENFKTILEQNKKYIKSDEKLKNKLIDIFNRFENLNTNHQKTIIYLVHEIIKSYSNKEKHQINHKH